MVCGAGLFTLVKFPVNKGTGGAFFLQKALRGTSRTTPGSVSLVGARAGDNVQLCVMRNVAADLRVDFEPVITVNDQIQQTSVTVTPSTETFEVGLSGGRLLSADSNPRLS